MVIMIGQRNNNFNSATLNLSSQLKLFHMSLAILFVCGYVAVKSVSILSSGVLYGVAGGSALLLSAICVPFVTPALRKICLPYVPATTAQVQNVIKGLQGRSGTLVDLGSGDGRIVLEAAKQGYSATGVELNPWLVLFSKIQAFRLGVSSSARFERKDIWKTDLSQYNNVVIFGVDSMMPQLEKKCSTELKKGSAVAACRFPFPDLQPQKVVGEGLDTVWVYSTYDSSPVIENKSKPNVTSDKS